MVKSRGKLRNLVIVLWERTRNRDCAATEFVASFQRSRDASVWHAEFLTALIDPVLIRHEIALFPFESTSFFVDLLSKEFLDPLRELYPG